MKKIKKVSTPHYVCTGGCGLVSDTPGNCRTQGCFRSRNSLTLCHCRNGKHGKLPTLNVPRD